MSNRGLDRRPLDGSADVGDAAAPGRGTLTSRITLQRRETRAPAPVREDARPTSEQHARQDQGLAVAMGFVGAPARAVQRASVQLSADAHTGLDDAQVRAAAAHGVTGPGTTLPHLEAIQRSFGPHDVSGVTAHVGGAAADASAALGAHAYATGDHVAFASAPSLALAAHEAAHVVQQRAGVHLSSAVGRAGDAYEEHADAVAARVVAGESAADLLGETTGVGVQRAAVQRDAKPAGDAPKVSEISVEESDGYVELLEDATDAFEAAHHIGLASYKVALAQANAKLIHDHVEEDYKKAQAAHEKAVAKSAFMAVFNAVSALASIATGVGAMVGAAKALYGVQKSLREAAGTIKKLKDFPVPDMAAEAIKSTKRGAWDEAKKGGAAIGEAAGGGGKIADGKKKLSGDNPDTILSDANHDAIKAGNDAADPLAEANVSYQLIDIWEQGHRGERKVNQWKRRVADMTTALHALPASRDGDFKNALDRMSRAQQDFESTMSKLRTVWAIYADHGYEALANPYEQPILDKLIGWAQRKDPRLAQVRFSMDQNMRRMRFHGTTTDDRATFDERGMAHIDTTTCHAYKHQFVQIESGNIYVKDPAVARELGLSMASMGSGWGKGRAENHEDEVFEGATKYYASIAMCKALQTIGVEGRATAATTFLTAPSGEMKIEERHQGAKYDRWMDTDEFTQFWRVHLGGRYGYLREDDESGPPKSFAGATDKDRERSRAPWDPTHRS
jgi:hypothetical protein